MKKRATTVIAAALAFTLAVPVTGTVSTAAEKAPKLTPKNGATILTGETKTFKIKNVKASNVKSLKVKVFNASAAKLKSKTKTSFVVEGVGGGLSDMEVTVKLKKAQAGKTVYKFENITIAAGSGDVPNVHLVDEVSKGALTAMVLKAGSKVDFDNIDNQLELQIGNGAEIGGRNLMIHWFEDGEEKYEWSRDGAGGKFYRPDTENVVINDPVSGPAVSGPATGFDPSASGIMSFPSPWDIGAAEQHVYQCVVNNTLSHKTAITGVKLVRIVSPSFIEMGAKRFEEFTKMYPVEKSGELLKTQQQKLEYMMAFRNLGHAIGVCIGMTDRVLNDMYLRIHAEGADLNQLNQTIFKPFEEKMRQTGKYLGISDELISQYFRHFGFIVNKSLTDSTFSLDLLDYK